MLILYFYTTSKKVYIYGVFPEFPMQTIFFSKLHFIFSKRLLRYFTVTFVPLKIFASFIWKDILRLGSMHNIFLLDNSTI